MLLSKENTDLVKYFDTRVQTMVEATRHFVSVESPTSDIGALDECAGVLDRYMQDLTGVGAQWIHTGADKRPHLRFDFGERTDVMLTGHFDTVYPIGTLAEHPFRIDGDRMYGPGVLDMKSGLVLIAETVHWMQQQISSPNITVVFNSDEETGSEESGPVLREIAPGAQLIMVYEFTDLTGALKIGARGIRRYRITVHGKGGHSAYPEIYSNPVEGIAEFIVALKGLSHPSFVVTPTVLEGSEGINVVPDSASMILDVRAETQEGFDRIDAFLRSVVLSRSDLMVDVDLFQDVPPFPGNAEGYPWKLAQSVIEDLGLNPVEGIVARGGSDANQVGYVNPNAIEAMGAIGEGPHQPGLEYALISSLSRQAAMGAAMCHRALVDAASLRETS